MTPDHDNPASLEAMKKLLRQYVEDRAGVDPSNLASDLREACDLLLAEAARHGIAMDEVIGRYRAAIARTGRPRRRSHP